MGTVLLHSYEGNEILELFNENFNGLFNHYQTRNKLLFFSIDSNTEQYIVQLNEFIITDNADLQRDSNVIDEV